MPKKPIIIDEFPIFPLTEEQKTLAELRKNRPDIWKKIVKMQEYRLRKLKK